METEKIRWLELKNLEFMLVTLVSKQVNCY